MKFFKQFIIHFKNGEVLSLKDCYCDFDRSLFNLTLKGPRKYKYCIYKEEILYFEFEEDSLMNSHSLQDKILMGVL